MSKDEPVIQRDFAGRIVFSCFGRFSGRRAASDNCVGVPILTKYRDNRILSSDVPLKKATGL